MLLLMAYDLLRGG